MRGFVRYKSALFILPIVGCGTNFNEALFLAAEAGTRTTLDVLLSQLITDLPIIFTSPPAAGESPQDPPDTDTPDDDGEVEPPDIDDGGPPVVGSAIQGEMTYMINACGLCHCDDGSGGCLPGAPDLRGSGADVLRAKLIGDSNHVGGQFPDLTDQDLSDLVAFLGG